MSSVVTQQEIFHATIRFCFANDAHPYNLQVRYQLHPSHMPSPGPVSTPGSVSTSGHYLNVLSSLLQGSHIQHPGSLRPAVLTWTTTDLILSILLYIISYPQHPIPLVIQYIYTISLHNLSLSLCLYIHIFCLSCTVPLSLSLSLSFSLFFFIYLSLHLQS